MGLPSRMRCLVRRRRARRQLARVRGDQLEHFRDAALELRDLDVVYRVRGRDREVLRGVSLEIGRGEAYGLVGESGCGKSTAALAIVRYLPANGRVVSGSIHVDGEDLLAHSRATLRRLRAEKLSMVYQNPAEALNPSIRVGRQVAEVFRIRGESRDTARQLAEMRQLAGVRGPFERNSWDLA